MSRADRRARHAAFGLGLLGLAAACGSTTPRAGNATATVRVAGAPASDKAGADLVPIGPFTITAAAMPQRLAVDGNLQEWGDGKRAPRVVFVAVDEKKLALAASWPEAAKGSVAIAISTTIPEVPEIGWTQRGGSTHELTDETCQFEQIALAEANWKNGDAHPPEVVEQCRAVMKRHAEFTARFRERFVRRFRLSASGIEALDAAGKASPINGATHRATADGVEVELPLSAMPRIAQAPLESLEIAVAEGKLPSGLLPPTADERQGWTEVKLQQAVAFAPHGALRAQIAVAAPLVVNSYDPGKPEIVHSVSHAAETPLGGKGAPDRAVVVESEETIFTKTDEHGDVVIGVARAAGHYIATYRGGQLVAVEGFPDVRGTKKVGDDLHLFGYDEGGFTWAVGTYVPPRWRVLAVAKDGKLTEIADEGVDWVGMWNAWDNEPKPYFDRDFAQFGIRGKRGKRPKTVTWKWDEKERKYVSDVTPRSQSPSP